MALWFRCSVKAQVYVCMHPQACSASLSCNILPAQPQPTHIVFAACHFAAACHLEVFVSSTLPFSHRQLNM